MLGESFDMSTLRAVGLFAPLSDDELELLRPALSVVVRNVGDVVIHEGDPGKLMFVLLVGEVKVVRSHRESDEKVIATIQPVESFGGMSLITGETRSATVLCTDTCRFLAIEREGLENVLLQHPSICLELLREAYKHLRSSLDASDSSGKVR